jgi:hypothetical protein
MAAIEDLLREELKRVTDEVRPEQLRPLRMPVHRPRWHLRLLPIAAASAVVAVAVVAVLLARTVPGPRLTGIPTPSAGAFPRYYLTFTYVSTSRMPQEPEAVIRDSATGQIIGTAGVPTDDPYVAVTAAPDDRSFIIGAYEPDPASPVTQYQVYRLFRLPLSADGKPGHLTELPVYPPARYGGATGIALSPDGKLLALSLIYGPSVSIARPVAMIEVINLVTGKTRTWTARTQGSHYYIPGPPSWADGDRMIAFTWQRGINPTTTSTAMEGVRLLDTAESGGNLMDSTWILPSRAVDGTIQSALITPDGRDILVAISRNIPSSRRDGTTVMQIVEVQTASGKPVRVLRTQTARYGYKARNQYFGGGDSQVWSLDPTGRYALVTCPQLGWLDIAGPEPGRFTPLPGPAALPAAW